MGLDRASEVRSAAHRQLSGSAQAEKYYKKEIWDKEVAQKEGFPNPKFETTLFTGNKERDFKLVLAEPLSEESVGHVNK